jgi:hypothetical protein
MRPPPLAVFFAFVVVVCLYLRRPRPSATYAAPASIDCVRLISGATSTWRLSALAELSRVGFPASRVSVQSEALDRGSHKRGCHNAHVRAHAWAVSRGCSVTLVVEDDVVFSDDMAGPWSAVERAFSRRGVGAVDALWLGYTAVRIDRAPAAPGLARIQKPMLTHAGVFPVSTSRRIVGMPPWREAPSGLSVISAYDVHLWYTNVTRRDRIWGVFPVCAGQRRSQSASYSRDKNPFQDWGKSLSGLRWLNWLSVGRCTQMYTQGGAAASWLGSIKRIESLDDWTAAARVLGCDDVETLSPTPPPRLPRRLWRT